MEWVDNLSDWRWVSKTHDIYGPNPNMWCDAFCWLPKQFSDAIRDNEGDHAEEVQDTIANHLLDHKQDAQNQMSFRKYKFTYVLPLSVEDVS